MRVSFFVPPREISPYCWLVEIGSMRLGVHKHDGWYMQLGERLLLIDSEDKCMPLLPILEIEGNKFFEFLKAAEVSAPDYSEIIYLFPKDLLLKHAFHTSFSGYWPEKALAWLIDDSNLQPKFENELKNFINNKVMPQGARQKASKILETYSATARQILSPSCEMNVRARAKKDRGRF